MGWETPRVSDLPTEPIDPDLRLRAIGFLVTVAGALAAGIGAMLTWVSVSLPSTIPVVYIGVDLVEGTIALALAVVALVAVLASRIAATGSARRGAAVLVVIAGIAIVAIAGGEALTAPQRFRDDAIADVTGTFGDELIDTAAFEAALDVRLGTGLWLTLVGGLATVGGGLVTLAWTSRRRRAQQDAPLEPRPDDPTS
jgi:hypothetical protein